MIDPVKQAPIPLVVINGEDVIQGLNAKARQFGFSEGELITRYIPDCDAVFAEAIQHTPQSRAWHFTFVDSEKTCKVFASKDQDLTYCWIQDLSENLALSERLRQHKEPTSRQIRQINHQVSTSLGYAELLEVIMDDPGSMSSDKLSLVSQYQAEVRESLQKIYKIVQQENFDPRDSDLSILVAEPHDTLNELICELLKAEGYKVVNFVDAESAVKFYQLNKHTVQKAVIDDSLRCADGRKLPDALQNIEPVLEIVHMTSDSESGSADAIRKPVDFQQLLSAIQG